MTTVISVRFRSGSKTYYFDPQNTLVRTGDNVIVETSQGPEFAVCTEGNHAVEDSRVVQPLRPLVRVATENDRRTAEYNQQREAEAFEICQKKIQQHQLEMKLVDVEYAFDHSKIIFYFTANGRVDFRMLVKNLAGIFKTRIELRQIGVRDEAKMLGGIGPCGRPICCRTYLGDFTPVSIKMAKEQNLSLNPTKISGLCDRLMCCLKYEQDHYETTRKRMPRVGREIITPDGPGTINAINVLSETVRVRIAVGDAFELREYPIDDCQRPNQEQQAQQGEGKKERPPKAERPEKPERAEKTENEKAERPEKGERPEQKPRREKNERPEKGDKPQRDKKPEGDKPRQEKGERPEQKPRREKGDRPERAPKAQGEKKQPVQADGREEEKPAAEPAAVLEMDDVVEILETAALEDLL